MHPAVDDACVVGIDDEYSGEVPLAFVALSATYQDKLKSEEDVLELKQILTKV
jgi:4-coumarate--CoA ligase